MGALNIEKFKKNLEIKYYLPLKLKQRLVQEVISNCMEEKNEVLYVNYFVKEMVYKLCILSYYTNYQFTDKIDYDSLQEIGAFDFVINEIMRNHI